MKISDLSSKLTQSDQPMRVHLIGVAGSGMSGLASLLLGMGHKVSGCDRVTSGETERLQNKGLMFSCPHRAEDVDDAEVVIYSSAIRPENPAYARATELGIPTMRRAECLAAILHTKKGIIISGTHGKTTTSAMCAHILRQGEVKPSHYVGAEIPVLGTNACWDPAGELMVAEGDESDGTLALYQPAITVMLNIEEEHLDFYSGLDHICEVFTKLQSQTSGPIIYFAGCPVASKLNADRENTISYGFENADFTATNILETGGTVNFDVVKNGEYFGRIELGIPGRHNVLNSLAAIAVADTAGVSHQQIARALSSFAGAKRRFETKYLSPTLRIIDDYGHHPTELAATLQTARSLKPKRLVVLFQPHRFSRTQKLADEFGAALQAADRVFITDIYPASELPIEGITGQTIVDAMARHGDTPAEYIGAVSSAHHQLGNQLAEGDLLITLGAGNVHEAGTKIANDMQTLEEMMRFCGEMKHKLYEPMRRHTTMLVGGPAQFWLEPTTFVQFQKLTNYLRERSIPLRVIGRGSNLLVRDGGIRGAVIHPKGGEFSEVTVDGNLISAGSGVRFKKITSVAEANGLGDMEWMEGVPGNVGGGLRMNAGAMGWETFDHVVSVTFLDEDGEIRTRTRDEIKTFYRNVPEIRRNFALQATFRGSPADTSSIHQRIAESKQKRRESQPIAASAGCIFKNPAEIPAGKLVDELGMKEASQGNAQVSAAHGNFIINRGKATASDVLELISRIQDKAKTQRNIDLETEVQIIGDNQVHF
ncbi:UDP-N-acetylmuramate--L-alanine ligase [Persicirhabdus sediminis]|uniref:Multifunctional fusion protein n=1 Tax=Persicirhabdus sediminis TaxID=454144 RepID=A0A8J7MFE7_9BACT|nr:UDP-N-acetylmuramate--L-alanine ligase [Persicirhabdus sediminis]MBK1791731.1 UDP-N-acetylmuramate--L-alanine ligase [Persicirhabdus sediminis]